MTLLAGDSNYSMANREWLSVEMWICYNLCNINPQPVEVMEFRL